MNKGDTRDDESLLSFNQTLSSNDRNDRNNSNNSNNNSTISNQSAGINTTNYTNHPSPVTGEVEREQSGEPITPSQVTNIACARTSVQDVPPP